MIVAERLLRLEEHALEQINAIRSEWGVPELSEIPPGIPGDSCRCPVANALAPCGSPVVEPNLIFNSRSDALRAYRVVRGGSLMTGESCVLVIDRDFADFIYEVDGLSYPRLLDNSAHVVAE